LGFRRALEAAGLPLSDDLYVHGDYSHSSGIVGLQKLFAGTSPPTAILCANDVIAFGALDAARRLGVSVPDDLWIVGFDGIDMAGWDAFSLTTVRQPIQEMAARGIECLIERIEGRAPSRFRNERLPVELIVRGSTANHPPT
jgi:LacI family transcriptional regulator